MSKEDGNIDYSHYSRGELYEAYRSIDSERFPINYQRLQEAIHVSDSLVKEKMQGEDAEPTIRKPIDQIQREYQAIERRSNYATIAWLCTFVPFSISRWMEGTTFLGLTDTQWLYVSGPPLVAYSAFLFFYLKCPNCKKYPGNGWVRMTCASCKVALKPSAE